MERKMTAIMTDNPPNKIKIGRVLGVLAIILVCVFLVWLSFMRFIARDALWKWKVQGKVKPDELRAWTFQVISNCQADFKAERMLTNAPTYIARSDRHPPSVVPRFNCVEVIYGGGLYHWGLTIGDTNLTADWVRGGHVIKEKWAPGIYFWHE